MAVPLAQSISRGLFLKPNAEWGERWRAFELLVCHFPFCHCMVELSSGEQSSLLWAMFVELLSQPNSFRSLHEDLRSNHKCSLSFSLQLSLSILFFAKLRLARNMCSLRLFVKFTRLRFDTLRVDYLLQHMLLSWPRCGVPSKCLWSFWITVLISLVLRNAYGVSLYRFCWSFECLWGGILLISQLLRNVIGFR